MKKFQLLFLISIVILVVSCGWKAKNESNLTTKDLQFIRGLGILDSNETILLFETNGGFSGLKQSGNFITNKRMVSYWIENNLKDVNFAFYSQIDSLKLNNKTVAATLASSITIYSHDQTTFELYIDADSSRLNQFYDKTLEIWQKNK
jgi:hypothetical protein